jgi:intergrase/recombinase
MVGVIGALSVRVIKDHHHISEWVEVPVGVAAQIQGHKPSAIAEKHYRRRPLDLLRMWHDKIEA